MEFESSDRKKTVQSHVCVIYDPRTGRIVHGHTFVGSSGKGLFGPEGRADRERETLDGARRNHGDVSRLRVLHVPQEFRFEPNTKYRVDVKAGRMIEHLTFPIEQPRRKAEKRSPKKRAAKRR